MDYAIYYRCSFISMDKIISLCFCRCLMLVYIFGPIACFGSIQENKRITVSKLFHFFYFGLLVYWLSLWLSPELILYGVLILPLFIINLYFAKEKKERLLLNDLTAIIALSSVSMFIVHVGHGYFHWIGVKIWLLSIVYFMGTVFYVKSFIREKGNSLFKKQGYAYHSLIVLLPFLFGYWWISVLFLPSSLKYWLTPRKMEIRPLAIGIVEIIGSIVFVGLNVLLYK